MEQQVKQKRRPRSYKVSDAIYEAAVKVAAEKKTTLANLIEKFVTNLSSRKSKKQ